MQGLTYGERRVVENIRNGVRPDLGLNPKDAHIDLNNLLGSRIVLENEKGGLFLPESTMEMLG